MATLTERIPEIRCAADAAQVPWAEAVVWITEIGQQRVYEWVTAEHIRTAMWTNGNVSILPKGSSMLGEFFTALVIQGKPVFVGKKVPVS